MKNVWMKSSNSMFAAVKERLYGDVYYINLGHTASQ